MNILLIRPRPDKETIGLQHVMICEPLELEYIAANIDPYFEDDIEDNIQSGNKIENNNKGVIEKYALDISPADHKEYRNKGENRNLDSEAFNIEIIDMIVEKQEIEHFIKLYQPDIVGITSYITHVHTVKDYAKRIKSVKSDCIVAVGGVHAEVVPEDFVSDYIDYIIEADGIDTFNRIIRKVIERQYKVKNKTEEKYTDRISNKENTYENIQKIHEGNDLSRKNADRNKRITDNQSSNNTNAEKTKQMDERYTNSDIRGVYKEGYKNIKKSEFNYNHPARKKTAKYRKHYYYMFHNPCALVKTSFGCPYSCSFCFCKEVTGGRYFARDVDDVIAELKPIPEKEIYIVDDDFLFDANRLNEFCDALEKNNLDKRFLVYGRADFISENEELIRRLAKNGLSAVIVGLESFRDDDLDSYNKKTSIHQNERAVKILQINDIEVYATLILHLDFDRKDFAALKNWIYKMDLTFVNLQPLTPLPGTDIYEDYESDIIINREDYAKWDLAHLALMPKHMSIREYYFQIIKLYYQIVLKPKNAVRLIKKYGLKEVIKLSSGSSKITGQYIKKMIRNTP